MAPGIRLGNDSIRTGSSDLLANVFACTRPMQLFVHLSALYWTKRPTIGRQEDQMSEAERAIVYRIATAAVPLAVFYCLLAESAAALWLGMLGAVLGTGSAALAARNTPTGR